MQMTSATKNTDINWTEIDWKAELKNNITSVDGLDEYISLSAQEANDLRDVVDRHPMNIPRYYLELINPNDPDDPIRKLVSTVNR